MLPWWRPDPSPVSPCPWSLHLSDDPEAISEGRARSEWRRRAELKRLWQRLWDPSGFKAQGAITKKRKLTKDTKKKRKNPRGGSGTTPVMFNRMGAVGSSGG